MQTESITTRINVKDANKTNEKRCGGIKGVYDLFKNREQKGTAVITRYVYEDSKWGDPLYNLRHIMNGNGFMRMYDGGYVRLHIDGELMMSDTVMERNTNKEFIRAAKGRVLIAGLGIGMVLRNILDNPEVKHVTVIEKNKDVIDLVGPKFACSKLTIIEKDIFEYKTTAVFDCIYFDIWPGISQDNLEDIRKLHQRFKFNKPKGSFMDSWMKGFLQNERRKERTRW